MSETPQILTLPAELRLRIYEIALDKRIPYHVKTYLSISAVCWQIRAEVLPILLKDDRYLKSLSHLASWASRGSPELLKHVSSITLHVNIESLSSMKSYRTQFVTAQDFAQSHTPEWWEANYTQNFETHKPPKLQPLSFRTVAMSAIPKIISSRFPRKIAANTNPIASTWNALRAVGELRSIWILLKDQTDPECPKYDIEQQLVLDMVAAACPKMQAFTVFSNLLPLAYLRNFDDLRLLRFSGYSKATPDEILDILQSLKHLDSIIICRYPEYYDKDYGIATSGLSQYLSLTPAVLSKVSPLKRFEISHMTSRVPSEHITVPILKALRAHEKSLRSLSIHSDLPVDGEYLEELLSFILSSALLSLCLQLTIPKGLVFVINTTSVFPKSTRDRERKITDLGQFLAGRELVRVFVRASL
ncbi:hypothetical protein D0Z07_8423 [Hyphodiscus hymeniophilus]|uniref:Uncharacterized protein n=1 Tax=Hyphodiscus hymeniophilus TaxID=353542 RepID=A0A9P6VEF7_9HELO|nr:hypothetical protein D0Z07_8423 [Hyphodiscus hymeniophilus]